MAVSTSQRTTTYYEILELTPSASLQDIKKAYRRLALKHHPDRNPPSEKEAATVQFRRVNEAYEVLSDDNRRKQYDLELRHGPSSIRPEGSGGFDHRPTQQQAMYRHSHRRYRDPFAQFNDLFQNDPFFHEAFKEMDDLFAKTFQEQNGTPSSSQNNVPPQQPKKSWGHWIADCLGINFQISTSSTTMGPDGRPQTSYRSTSYGGNNRGQSQGNRHQKSSTYTSRSSRTVIENGQRVTIQSLEKDGNAIEEKYINDQLVQRLINGIPEERYRLDQGGNGDL